LPLMGKDDGLIFHGDSHFSIVSPRRSLIR
jgi:hypothetical protein